jgi:hypothetical protein
MSISNFSVTENNHFVLAKDVTQVFYIKDLDPANREEHHIVLQGKRKIVGVENVVDEEEYN